MSITTRLVADGVMPTLRIPSGCITFGRANSDNNNDNNNNNNNSSSSSNNVIK